MKKVLKFQFEVDMANLTQDEALGMLRELFKDDQVSHQIEADSKALPSGYGTAELRNADGAVVGSWSVITTTWHDSASSK